MAKTFSYPVTGDIDALLAQARSAAQQHGAQISGDSRSGTFSGQGVKGHYQVAGNTINVTIDEKPFIVPWPLLESQMKKFFQGGQ